MVVHYIDSCVPLGNLGWDWRDRESLDDREESEGLALLDWGKLRG